MELYGFPIHCGVCLFFLLFANGFHKMDRAAHDGERKGPQRSKNPSQEALEYIRLVHEEGMAKIWSIMTKAE